MYFRERFYSFFVYDPPAYMKKDVADSGRVLYSHLKKLNIFTNQLLFIN